MSPEWNTTERGVMRESETRNWGDDEGDYDAYSCMTVDGVSGHGGVRDVEDLTMLHGLAVESEADE